jgi:hypothetical protein
MIVRSTPVELVIPPPRKPRSPGVHLSSIIRCIATESGVLKPEWAEELSLVDRRTITDPVAITRICMGLAWEEFYIESQLPQVIDHPGEMLVDGVYMTHDGEELTTLILDARLRYAVKLHEVKCTFKSIKTVSGPNWDYWERNIYDSADSPIGPLSGQWMWVSQCKGYAKAAGTRLVDLHVLYVCWDYMFPIRPKAYRYSIEFTDKELDDNWALMTEYRDLHQHLAGIYA